MSQSSVYADFWLDNDIYSDYLIRNAVDGKSTIDLIQLSSVRRIISNYVDILTGESVPVYFKAVGDTYNVSGKEIYITTDIRRKKDFDRAVGLALHEAAHTVQSDFDAIRTIPFNAPASIWKFGLKHNIEKPTMERFLKTISNLIEDWFIDDWVLNRFPGYVGYYESCYDYYHNSQIINDLLLSTEFRYPSLLSYEFRLINFPNPLTDLSALPGLEEIARVASISTISRLPSTLDRIDVAYKIVEIVLQHLQKYHERDVTGNSNSKKPRIDIGSFFKNSGGESINEKSTDSTKTIQDVAATLSGKPKPNNPENVAMTTQTSKSPDKEKTKDAMEAVEQQIQFVHGDVDKEDLDAGQKLLLDLIEKHGISLIYVPFIDGGNDAALRVPCIVVKKLTMDLILAGEEVFPMSSFWKDEKGFPQPDSGIEKSVNEGIQLGNKLGRKLVIRRECHSERIIRKKKGKINRRLLHSAGFDADDIFERVKIHQYNRGSLHLTVDASTSMKGEKWEQTLKTCVAICKATSIVDNIHVTVSFRSTQISNGIEFPYVVLAYDSRIDRFSKIKQLFKYLRPAGCTPEGLAFASIIDLFSKASPDEEDRFFMNISDGEPFFRIKSPVTGTTVNYADGNGVEHTRTQVNKIRGLGVEILSYYIESLSDSGVSILFEKSHDTRKNFQIMYGRNAKFIKTDNIEALAKTINEMFLKKN